MNKYIIVIIALMSIITILILVYEIYQLYIWFTSEKVKATVKESLTDGSDDVLQYLYEINLDGKNYTVPGYKYETLNPLLALFPNFKVGKTETVRFNRRKMKILKNPISLIFEIFFVLLLIIINVIGIVNLAILMSYH